MAEEAQKPATDGEEKSPVFQTGMGAFDRAGFNKTFAETSGLGVKDEDIKKIKTADKVFSDASKYYKQKYDEEIKKIDPAFDPKIAESSQVSELTYNSNQRSIKKQIDEGKPLDGVKDIVPLAQEAAENKIGLVNKLKTGTVTTIAEYVGLKSIKDEDSYEEVSEEFSKAIPGVKFEELISKFWKNMSVFNSDQPGIETAVQKLYTPENNAIISALAKILEKIGFSSESVKNMSKRFDENLKIYSEKKSSKDEMPIPGAPGTTGATGTKSEQNLEKKEEKSKTVEGAKSEEIKTPSKIEEKTESKKENTPKENTPKLESTKIEGSKEPLKEGSKNAESTKNEISKTEVSKIEEKNTKNEVNKTEIVNKTTENKSGPIPLDSTKPISEPNKESKEPSASKKSSEEKISDKKESEEKTGDSNKNEGTSFIESLFGGLLGGNSSDKTEESKSEKSIVPLESPVNESVIEKTKSLDVPKMGGKKEILQNSISKLDTVKSGDLGSINKNVETLPKLSGIKEVTAQKLSPLSPPSLNKEGKATEEKTTNNVTGTEVSKEKETSGISSDIGNKKEISTEKKGETKEQEGEKDVVKALENKMDSVIMLLSQLNSTLQGPLLTINSSKKFD